MHSLFERVGNLGVDTFEELSTFSAQVTPQQRSKRHLADAMPHLPGVYLFRDERGRVLYIGTSKDLRTRVRSYFTSSEMRHRVVEMVAIAHDVVPVVCSTDLEARVRELRLIGEHKPPYNRRSKFPERTVWVKLTVETFPRLSIVHAVRDDGAAYLGPFGSRARAELAVVALHEALPLRQCRTRLNPRRPIAACVLAELGRCGSPCDGRQSIDDYAQLVDQARTAIESDVRAVVATLLTRIETLSSVLRYEQAGELRDRLAALVRAAARGQRLAALAGVRQLVAARATPDLGYEVAVIRYGRLTAAGTIPPGAAPRSYVDALIASAETPIATGAGPTGYAGAEEIECVLRWLESPGVRLVEVDGQWASPAHGAGGQRALLELRSDFTLDTDPSFDRRELRPLHQPARERPINHPARASA
jgi:DNA polymerase-3 subunit epsilon